ncbi:hypothetical protein TRVL_03657 [Trypanosoma vivax]|nr:hypothetical protein TRVL_03657 [Trypanosoma vivax]
MTRFHCVKPNKLMHATSRCSCFTIFGSAQLLNKRWKITLKHMHINDNNEIKKALQIKRRLQGKLALCDIWQSASCTSLPRVIAHTKMVHVIVAKHPFARP